MIKKIEVNDLNQMNSKGISDINLLESITKMETLLKSFKLEPLIQYVESSFKDIKKTIIGRDILELPNKLETLKEDWKEKPYIVINDKLKEIDTETIKKKITNFHDKDINKQVENMRNFGNEFDIDFLKTINNRNVSSNNFVNTKTVLNAISKQFFNEVNQLNEIKFQTVDDKAWIANNQLMDLIDKNDSVKSKTILKR